MGTSLINVSATGDVEARDGLLFGAVLSASAGNAASLVVKSGGSSGTTILTVTALAGDSVAVSLHGAGYASPLHATLTGTGAVASFEVG